MIKNENNGPRETFELEKNVICQFSYFLDNFFHFKGVEEYQK